MLDELSRCVVVRTERVHEIFDESVRHGRMTRAEADRVVGQLVEAGRTRRQELLVEREPVAEPRAPGRSEAAGSQAGAIGLPLPGYDEMIVSEVLVRLGELSPAGLRGVLGYEREHANRKSVLEALGKRLGE